MPPLRCSYIFFSVFEPPAPQVFVAQNRVRAIEGFEGLTRLWKLDLGANRIRCVPYDSSLHRVGVQNSERGRAEAHATYVHQSGDVIDGRCVSGRAASGRVVRARARTLGRVVCHYTICLSCVCVRGRQPCRTYVHIYHNRLISKMCPAVVHI